MLQRTIAFLLSLVALPHATGQGDPRNVEPDLFEPREPTSPHSYPSPNATGIGGWDVALAKAKRFVAQLSVDEKVSICTGNGFP